MKTTKKKITQAIPTIASLQARIKDLEGMNLALIHEMEDSHKSAAPLNLATEVPHGVHHPELLSFQEIQILQIVNRKRTGTSVKLEMRTVNTYAGQGLWLSSPKALLNGCTPALVVDDVGDSVLVFRRPVPTPPTSAGPIY